MQIRVLGALEVRAADGSAVEVSGSRLRLLLAALALEAPRAVAADVLVASIWGDSAPADPANTLQSLVSRLRRALGDAELVLQSPGGYRLGVDPADVDVHRFAALAKQGHDELRAGRPRDAVAALTDAVALWRGEPVDVPDRLDPALVRLGETCLDARADLIETKIALGHGADAVTDAEALVTEQPLREHFAALLVRSLQAAGRTADALAAFERTRTHLVEELGADPSAELQEAHLQVLRGEQPVARGHRSTNLRSALTTFVGRDEQLILIAKLLGTSRLVTLVGPGGAGKTRLAGVAAADVDEADGVWIAELAPVSEPADVPSAVLGVLGQRESILIERAAAQAPRDTVDRIVDAFGDRPTVLVLDNCEHLLDAAARLADELLTRSLDLRIIATSREPLGISGESVVVIPPLGQPESGTDAVGAVEFPAVRLFEDRAADAAPGFTVNDGNVASVVEIVRRLDGLPLAIELAAARLRTMPIEEIARRIDDRFRLLTGGSRTAMPRHRTLRAVVEWSWDLLTPDEKLLTERLAVFAGGVTPESAAAVCSDDGLDRADVDDVLLSLVEKSLLQRVNTTDGRPRYRMLETIREFGIDRMAERGDVGRTRLRHAEFFAELTREAEPLLRTGEQLGWMRRLELERDNVLAALKFFGDDGDAAAATAMVGQLGWYWMTAGAHGEIVTWCQFALASSGPVDPMDVLMLRAFSALNQVAWDVHDAFDDDADRMTELRAVTREMAAMDPAETPPIIAMMTPIMLMFTGDVPGAIALTECSLQHQIDPWIKASLRTFRASMAENEGDLDAMAADAEISLAAFRTLGERWGMANSLQLLGQHRLVVGRLAEAADAYREALALTIELGGHEDVAMMRLRLADILSRMGRSAEAQQEAALAFQAAERSGSVMERMFTQITQADVDRQLGDLSRAEALRDGAMEPLLQLSTAHPMHAHGRGIVHAVSAKIDLAQGRLDDAATELTAAVEAGVTSGDMPILAGAAVAVAMYAHALGRDDDAAEILGAAAQLRGGDDLAHPDVAELDTALGGVLDGPHAACYARGKALTRDEARARVDPGTLAAAG